MARFDPAAADWYQQTIRANAGDQLPVPLTVLQAQKIVAIVSAGRQGHQVYADATAIALDFLEASALEALQGTHVDVRLARGSAELWEVLDELPWPVPGPPRPQAE